MSEKELLKVLEEDTKRECTAILENARKEADAITQGAAEEVERLREERLKKSKVSLQRQRIRILINARLYVNEVILKERLRAMEKVLEGVCKRFQELPRGKDYPEVLKRLFKEAMDKWSMYRKGEKPIVVVSKQDLPFLRSGISIFRSSSYDIIPDDTGDMSPGVMVMSKDKRFKMINTVHARLEKARSELDTIIDRELFGGR